MGNERISPVLCIQPYLFLIYASLSSLSVSLCSVVVKRTLYMSPGQLSLVRHLGMIAFNVPLVARASHRLNVRGNRRSVALCCFLTGTGLTLRFYAYRFMPLGEAAVISCSTPFVIAAIARIYLRETLGATQVWAAVLAVAGILLSTRLPQQFAHNRGDAVYYAGVAAEVGAVLCLSAGSVLTRKLKHVHFALLNLLMACFGSLENLLSVSTLESWRAPRCGRDGPLMVALGFFAFLSQGFIVLALHAENASMVILVKSSMDVVFAVLLQAAFFGEVPDAFNASGAVLVTASTAVIALRQWLSSAPEESKWRGRLKCLLL